MAAVTKEQIIESLSSMTALELSDLVKDLEDKFGVTAAAPVAVAAMPVAGEGAAAVEEKTEFDVAIESIGSQKIQVIKVVREITGLGLKEAKAVVDNAPGVVKEGVSKDEAEKMKAKLEEVGATATIK